MTAPSRICRAGIALLLAASATLGCAQAQKEPPKDAPVYEPTNFQAGKDVVWVPTPQAVVDKMLDLAKVTQKDFVMDLGSGDGRTVITAAMRGARALGVEYNPDMVALSKRNAEKNGVAGSAEFITADLFETDFSRASVITMFLLPSINLRLRPKILALKPGTRIVSNTFTMDDWQPDETATLGSDAGCNTSWCTALLWIVPAQVAGDYKLPQGDFSFKQTFQQLSGALSKEGKTFPISGTVAGEELYFTAGGQAYHGRVNGKALQLLP